MDNYCRILPVPLAKKDFAASLALATRLAGSRPRAEITLFAPSPFTIIAFFDGIVAGGERKKLVTGETIPYQGRHLRYATAIDVTQKYDVILAINCLPEIRMYHAKIVLASVSPDDYFTPCDDWIRHACPARF